MLVAMAVNKRRYYSVSYAHKKGFGRRFMSSRGPLDEATIERFENKCEPDGCCLIAITEIKGPITVVD